MVCRDTRRVPASVPFVIWNRELPSVDAVRPSHCPACSSASRPVGRGLVLVGHGRRLLDMLGPPAHDAPPGFVEVLTRRYRCRACSALCTVVPGGIGVGRRYLRPAIALALTLWAIRGLPERRVRRQISPNLIVGSSVTGWASLRRWAHAYGIGTGSLRQRAERYVTQLLARSPLSAQHHAIEPRIVAASLHPH